MFSMREFVSAARALIVSIASSANSIVTSSVLRSSVYWRISAFFGSVKIFLKSSACRDSNSTRSGKRPCNSGIKSLGLERLNAPAAINKI